MSSRSGNYILLHRSIPSDGCLTLSQHPSFVGFLANHCSLDLADCVPSLICDWPFSKIYGWVLTFLSRKCIDCVIAGKYLLLSVRVLACWGSIKTRFFADCVSSPRLQCVPLLTPLCIEFGWWVRSYFPSTQMALISSPSCGIAVGACSLSTRILSANSNFVADCAQVYRGDRHPAVWRGNSLYNSLWKSGVRELMIEISGYCKQLRCYTGHL